MLQILGKTMRKKDLTNRLKNYEYCAKKTWYEQQESNTCFINGFKLK